MSRLDDMMDHLPDTPGAAPVWRARRGKPTNALTVTFAVRPVEGQEPQGAVPPPAQEVYGPVGLARRLRAEGFIPDALEGNTFKRPSGWYTLTATVEGKHGAYWAANVAAWMTTVYGRCTG